MASSSCIGSTTMKPSYCRILINYKRSSFLGFQIPNCNHHSSVTNLSKSRFKLHGSRGVHTCNSKSLGFRDVIDLNRKGFCGSGLNRGGYDRRFNRLVFKVASDYRNYSTSIESHVNDTSWEKIYIQGGLNVKPLVIDSVEKKEENEEKVLDDNCSNVNIKYSERKESEIEKEAWNLLRGSVVNYCGSPVGTVAAADPADKLPLNYDQVFIRDFVPLALALLLNGEGEIVKNFLLHTLQLQAYDK